jgi:glutathione S-transferase
MHYVELVATLALLQFLTFGVLTGNARRASGLKAPAVTGHDGFERMYRVQMNTLELLIVFLPALFLAAKYWSPTIVALIGGVYLIGRILYWRGYVNPDASRSLGFFLSMMPALVLCVMALTGIISAIVGIRV